MHGYRNGQLANSAVMEVSKIDDRQKRRSPQRRGEQSGKSMVEMERTEWSDLRQESSNENETPDIPDSDWTDDVLRGRNMANVSERLKAYGNNRDGNGAMSDGGEPVRTTKT